MKITGIMKLKWAFYRLLEWVGSLRDRGATIRMDECAPVVAQTPAGSKSLWIFVSTIGELNAIEPFLRMLLSATENVPLVLLTDHSHYRASFLSRFPNAKVYALDHRTETAAALIEASPPRLLLLAEIPCMLSDSPCRFPFALVYKLKQRGVPVCMINGWLYRLPPSCTMDSIEKQLFGRDYLRLFDLMTVQDDATRDALMAEGADPQRVFVTGNTKFDAVGTEGWIPGASRNPVMLQEMVNGNRPVIIAGSVTDIAEQVVLLDAFRTILQEFPQTLLVIAPRHPEVRERMGKLRLMLTQRGLSYAFKTRVGDSPLPGSLNCLVLDTLGELRDFYAAGSLAYVGLNHNVLEPLAFATPVVVGPGWNPTYPSYPVYRRLLDESVIKEADARRLGETLIAVLREPVMTQNRIGKIGRMLSRFKGASLRNAELLARFRLLDHQEQEPAGSSVPRI